MLARASDESPHIRNFVSDHLVDVLTTAYLFLRSLSRFPDWFYELETRIYQTIDGKKGQAQRVIAAGRS